MVSHSQDFMNGICTNIIHMHHKQLNYYTGKSPLKISEQYLHRHKVTANACSRYCSPGDFDSYVRTRGELEENQMKQYRWEQEQISHMKVGPYALLLSWLKSSQ